MGTREILDCWFEGRPTRKDYLMVDGGQLAGEGRSPAPCDGGPQRLGGAAAAVA